MLEIVFVLLFNESNGKLFVMVYIAIALMNNAAVIFEFGEIVPTQFSSVPFGHNLL